MNTFDAGRIDEWTYGRDGVEGVGGGGTSAETTADSNHHHDHDGQREPSTPISAQSAPAHYDILRPSLDVGVTRTASDGDARNRTRRVRTTWDGAATPQTSATAAGLMRPSWHNRLEPLQESLPQGGATIWPSWVQDSTLLNRIMPTSAAGPSNLVLSRSGNTPSMLAMKFLNV